MFFRVLDDNLNLSSSLANAGDPWRVFNVEAPVLKFSVFVYLFGHPLASRRLQAEKH